jgi:predicted ArsR family transcriptional regulator
LTIRRHPFDALGDEGLRRVFLLARSRRQVTATEVAEELSVPRTVARWRLERLASAGLLQTGFERRRAGRPAKVYSAAPEAGQIELPSHRYERLVSLLLHRRRKSELRQVGGEFGRELADSIGLRRGAGLEALCRGLGELGFQAAVAQDGTTLLSATCPMRPVLVADPDARAVDEGMWSGLVERAIGKRQVQCRTHDCVSADGPCRIEVAFSD